VDSILLRRELKIWTPVAIECSSPVDHQKRRTFPTPFLRPLFDFDGIGRKQIFENFFPLPRFELPKSSAEHTSSAFSFAIFNVPQHFLLLPVEVAVGNMPSCKIDFSLDEIGNKFISPLCGMTINDRIFFVRRCGVDESELPGLLNGSAPESIFDIIVFVLDSFKNLFKLIENLFGFFGNGDCIGIWNFRSRSRHFFHFTLQLLFCQAL
jgi:hypothetical protein